ncbi:hypothetical protein IFT36_04805 [Frigoribacterium sp. CFBP 13605]|uniref:hypothetical protein n=1 Tax=Frigoribacterium sp. CFBP 13605 TaxID=2774034 RepID=UPI001904B189|nr:hypothetical protein [Frigoribacterium sp. CFBP 13605]MBD8139863.1 hypothetical protein [Frigoribacterium sp. CFBP 13605]
MDEDERVDGQHLVENLALSRSSLVVWGAPEERHARGWALTEADVVLDSGRPFGSLLYREVHGGRTERVAVRWNNVEEQLHCFVVNRKAPEEDRRRLELDARSRAAAFMAIHAELGVAVSGHRVASSGVRAAAHLLPAADI